MKKILICLTTFIVLMLLVKAINIFSFYIADLIYPSLAHFDPDNVFIVLTIHHISQALIVLTIILALSKVLKLSVNDFGFNLNEFRFSIKAVLIFTGIWSIVQAGAGVIIITLFSSPTTFSFPVNTGNFTGYFLFEILLSGTSEELMFRALVMTLMFYLWKNLFQKASQLTLSVILCSTLIFMLDHINFSFSPFTITHINWLQQITACIFGIFYGYLFSRTKSITGPILAHNFLNGAITVIALALSISLG